MRNAKTCYTVLMSTIDITDACGNRVTIKKGTRVEFKSDSECTGTVTGWVITEYNDVWLDIEVDYPESNYGQFDAHLPANEVTVI